LIYENEKKLAGGTNRANLLYKKIKASAKRLTGASFSVLSYYETTGS